MKYPNKNALQQFTRLLMVAMALVIAALPAVAADRPVSHKVKRSMLVLTEEATIGTATLAPGTYNVERRDSATGAVIRLIRMDYDPTAQETVSAYSWETVAEVEVTAEPLPSKARKTELMLGSGSRRATGLVIQGDAFGYLF